MSSPAGPGTARGAGAYHADMVDMAPGLLSLLLLATPAAPLADVPFEDDSSLIFVRASLNGSRPLSFMVDTGFDVNVLNADVATELGLKAEEVHREAQPGGEMPTATLPPGRLTIGGLEVADVSFTSIPLTPLAPFVGQPMDGILGHDFLERYVVDFDYPARRLRLLAPQGFAHSGPGQVLLVEVVEKEPFVQVGVALGGRTVYGRFKIDTGSFVIDTMPAALPPKSTVVLPSFTKLVPVMVIGGPPTEGPLLGETVATVVPV